MSDIISERRLINLNSADAILQNEITSYKSNVIFNFPSILQEENDIVYLEGGIYNCQFPISFYTINYTNNTFKFRTYDGVTFVNHTITIPVGNYNFTSFASAITTAFATVSHIMVVTINKTTGILTFTFTPTVPGTNLYSFIESGFTMWNVCGFYTGSGNVLATSNVIIAPYPLNLLGIKLLKIFSNTLAVESYDSKNISTSTLIDSVPNYSASYQLLTHSNPNGLFGKMRSKRIQQIDIQIKDENDNFINFNNIDWTLCLAIVIYRRINNEKFNSAVLEDTTLNTENTDGQTIPTEEQSFQPSNENQNTAIPVLDVGNLDDELQILLQN
jgi:hypothetical protein